MIRQHRPQTIARSFRLPAAAAVCGLGVVLTTGVANAHVGQVISVDTMATFEALDAFRTSVSGSTSVSSSSCGGESAACSTMESSCTTGTSHSASTSVQTVQNASDDPVGFLSALTRRYAELKTYEDTSRVVRVTERDGSEPTRTETDVRCRIDGDGSVQVETGGSALREALGIALPFRSDSFLGETIDQYEIWLAPHLALRAPLGPLKMLSEQSNEALTATRASAVMLDERDMVQLDLTSGDADSPSAASRYSLYVNPESMLVERVETEHRLANGVVQSTTVDISPQHATAATAAVMNGIDPAVDAETDAATSTVPANVPAQADQSERFSADPVSPGSAGSSLNADDDAEPSTLGILDLFEAGMFSNRDEDHDASCDEDSDESESEAGCESSCSRGCDDGFNG